MPSFVEIRADRTKLINGFESYQSIAETKASLDRQSLEWKVTGESGLAPGDKRPPFNMYEITVENYSHAGCPGALKLDFFNNRLTGTRFHPAVPMEQYVQALAAEEDIRVNDGHEKKIPPFTRVWLQRVSAQGPYVGWVDTRLRDEENLWIGRYS